MSWEEQPLLLDRREKVSKNEGADVLAAMIRSLNVPVKVTELEFGDAQVTVRGPDDRPILVGVERKKVSDLIDGFNTGRLTLHQLPGMMESYETSYLLLEGLWTAGKKGELLVWSGSKKAWQPPHGDADWKYESFVQRLLTLEFRAGVRIAYTGSVAGSGAWLASLWRWSSRSWNSHKTLEGIREKDLETENPLVSFFSRPTPKMRVAAAVLRGVGYERAKAISSHFRSIREMVTAGVSEWIKIDGIGKKLAAQMVAEIERVDR